MAFLSVSEPAWEIIHNVNYTGYDALKPFFNVQEEHYFPYTPNWHGVAGLNAGAELILSEGLDSSYARHETVAEFCRNQIINMGLALFPGSDTIPSPTVTAVNVPDGIDWPEFDLQLRQHGLVVGGSYGPMAGKVFRLGHMGIQADMELVKKALNVINSVAEKI
jgi:aspartate aminotransferase-like enzyme